jgi:flagellar basal-body rod protein FlgB
MPASGGGPQFATDSSGRYAVRPRGNSVTHEDEMMKVASNQLDFEAAASLYTHSLALIKLAIGK